MKLIIVLPLLLAITACGGNSKPDRKDEPAAPIETAAASGPVTAPSADPNAEIGATTPAEKGEVTYEGNDLSKVPRTAEVPYAEENTEFVGDVAQQVLNQKNGVAAKPATTEAAVVKTPEANKVLGWLKNGNTRYVKRRFRADGQSPADRARLLSGQNPHAIVFTCSDSRVPPEIIFDQKLGELYVIRNDELTMNEDVLRSLDKGAEAGAKLLVVLSYEGCSSDAIKANLAERKTTGRLKIQPATYDLKSGVVKFE